MKKFAWGAVALVVSSAVAVSAAQGQSTIADADAILRVPETFDLRIVEKPEISLFSTTQNGPDSWGLDRIDQVALPLDDIYRYENDGTGVKVYVVDTGIRRTHEEFEARVDTGYVAPLTGESTTDDCEGHGTHVAGTVGGVRSGVAKKVTIVPVRVFDCAGASQGTWLVEGIRWIIDNHQAGEPAVANLSLGADNNVPSVDQAVRDLVADGVTVVVAAGNDNTYLNPAVTNPSPSCVREAIIVGASGSDDKEWYRSAGVGSSFGSCVDLFAPGVDIVSAWNVDGQQVPAPSDDSYAYSTGTSMAAPHVAGAAALLLQSRPELTPAEVKQILLGAASSDKITYVTRTAGQTLTPNKLLFTCSSLCPPSAPRNVSVLRNGSGAISVSWAAPTSNGGSAVTGYKATALPGGQSCTTTEALSCVITGLANGTAYSVTLTATNAVGTSGISTAVSITPATVPAATSAPTVVGGDMNAVVTWTAPDSGGSAITGYTVTSSPGSLTCVTSGELTCTVAGLSNGTNYTFSVVATNGVGAGAASAASAAVMPAATWISGPSEVSTKPGSKKVTVSWLPAVLSSGQPVGYVVRDATGATVCSATGTATSCVVANLKNGAAVAFSLSALSVANESAAVATPKTVVGGLFQAATAMKRNKTYSLSSIAKTGSKGKATWKKVSGQCTISGQSVKAPSKKGTCKLRVSVAKSSPYPAQKLVVTLPVS